MSQLNAFCESKLGAFMESPLGARGCLWPPMIIGISETTNYVSTGGSEANVITFDEFGGLTWIFASGSDTDIRALLRDGSGNVYATGSRISTKTMWKRDSDGGALWNYDAGSGTRGDALALGGGYVYVGGVNHLDRLTTGGSLDTDGGTSRDVFGLAADGTNLYVAKERASSRSFERIPHSGFPSNDWSFDTGAACFAVLIDSSGYAYIAGTRSTGWPGAGGANATVWKLDMNESSNSADAVVWTYDTTRAAVSIALDADENLLVGTDRSNTSGDENCLFKLESDGDLVWAIDAKANVFAIDVNDQGLILCSGAERRVGSSPAGVGVLLVHPDEGHRSYVYVNGGTHLGGANEPRAIVALATPT